MPGPSSQRSVIIAQRREQIAQRYLQGERQHVIAAALGTTQAQISLDLKAIRQLWLQSALVDFDAAKAQELAKIDLLEQVAWDAWARSKQPKEISLTEQVEPAAGGRRPVLLKASVRREEQVGDPRFLERVHRCIEQRCLLLGLISSVENMAQAAVGLASLLQTARAAMPHAALPPASLPPAEA